MNINNKKHFNHIARKYNYYRTLDEEPINFIVKTTPIIVESICDLGTGTGRYLIPLVESFQASSIPIGKAYGVDNNSHMLDIAKQQNGNINWILTSADNTGLPTQSISLVTSFNSIHHLPIFGTLAEVERILIPHGFFAIYIRVQDQESKHIFGRWFPNYLDYSQVPTRYFMTNLHYYNSRFSLTHIQDFTFKRKATLKWIREQIKNKYYSTFDRYDPEDFAKAFSEFLYNIKANYEDLNKITYNSNYSLFIYKITKEG